jgi:hypothetical protein
VVEIVVVFVVGFHELITASFHLCAVALYWLSGADVPFLPCYVRPYLINTTHSLPPHSSSEIQERWTN